MNQQSYFIPVAMASPSSEATETAVAAEPVHTEEAAHAEGLSINPSTVAFQALNLLILLFALHFIIFKPILKLLDERAKKIQEGLENADKAKKELEETTMIRKDMIKSAQVESQEMIEKGRKAGEEVKATIIQDAHKEAAMIIEKAQKVAEAEKANAMKELREEAAHIVLKATEKFLREKLNPEKDAKLIQENLSQIFS